MTEEKREFAFIIDEPAKEDFFNTHKPVATAISQSILLNSHLKIIGLLGRWGSGKSTIVHEVTAQLRSANNKFLIFNYDAWLHQNDPLRRSFLESLVDFLRSKSASDGKLAIDGVAWDKTLAKLSGAIEESKREETPIITSEGKLVFVLAGAFALGLSFLGLDTFRDGMGKTITDAGIWTLFLAATLIIGPFFIWLCYFAYRLDSDKKPSFFPDHLFNRSIGPVHTLTQKDLDPTSIEFGREFRNLMKEVTTNGFRLAIIIDNMDRVDDKEAMSIWANARSFFLSENDDNQLDSAPFHPTLILPIDFKSIAQMFAIESDKDKGEALAHSFINKTFDVTFEVPAPVMSDWKRYLDYKMKECLLTYYNEERAFRVRRFLEAWFLLTGTPITPREINKALNRLVALLMQWKDSEIPFDTIAWFSINRSRIGDEIEKEFLRTDHPLARFSADWARELAALYYGVNIELAGQVLMTGPIERAILNNSPKSLEPYRKLPGYGDILHQVTESLPSDDKRPHPNFEIIGNAARILSLEADAGPWHDSCWRNLILAFNTITGPGYDVTPTGFAERMGMLFDNIEESEADDFFYTAQIMIDRLVSTDNLVGPVFEAIGTVGTRLYEFGVNRGIDNAIYDVSGDAPKYIRVLAGLHKYPVAQSRIRTNTTHDDLLQELQRRATDQIAVVSVAPLVKLLTSPTAQLMIKKPFETLDPLIETFENQIRNNSGDTAAFVGAVRSLDAIQGFEEQRRSAFRRLAEDGTFSAKLSQVAGYDDDEALAVMLAVLVWVKADVRPPIGLTWYVTSEKYPDIAEKSNAALDTLIDEEAAIDVLLGAFDANVNTRGLVEALANDRVRRNAMGPLPFAKVIGNLSSYNRMIDWPLRQQFASQLAHDERFDESVEAARWNGSLLETGRLLEKAGGSDATKFRARMIEKIEKASSAEWRDAVEQGAEPFQIATTFLAPEEIKLGTNSSLVTALVEIASAVAMSGRKPLVRWFALVALLGARGRRKALSAIAEAAHGLPPKSILKLLKSGGMRLLNEGGFQKHPEKTIRGILIPLARHADGRAWLRDRVTHVRQILEKAPASAQDGFRKIVSEATKAPNANKRHWGEIIGRELGISH